MQIAEQVAETVYYRHADGSVSQRTVTGPAGGPAPALPEGAEEITEAEYDDAVAAMTAAREEHLAEVEEAARATALADYEALLAAGIPEATARRMSGYTPEEPQ